MLLFKRIPLLAVTFLSAFLIFSVQPMVAQKLTPFLGGAPAVWNSLLMLFQCLLFTGYLFVGIFLKSDKKPPGYIFIFLVFISLPLLFISLTTQTTIPDVSNPNLWVLYKGIIMVGLPFFVLATTAPLTQKLFLNARLEKGDEPYWLYSISNFGSFVALISYPFLIQPNIGLEKQLYIWAILFAVFALLMLHLFFKFYFQGSTSFKNLTQTAKTCSTPPLSKKLSWLLLAFCPASLIHGVTAIITNDISSFPILWVIPLCLYLATYVLTFSGKMGFIGDRIIRLSVIISIIPLCILPLWYNPIENIFILLAHLTAFFILSFFCHLCLYNKRPEAENLGTFYIWLAAGGFLAGIFNALIAPYIFEKIYEYPFTIILSVISIFYFTQAKDPARSTSKYLNSILLFIFLCIVFVCVITYTQKTYGDTENILILAILSISIIFFTLIRLYHPFYTTMCISVALLSSGLTLHSNVYLPDFKHLVADAEKPYISRSFFGISKVVHTPITPDVTEYLYYNGFILHSAERYVHSTNSMLTDKGTYHTPVIDNATKLGKPVASLGLGSGSDLCLAQGKTKIEFYEISQDVINIASNPDLLKSLSLCGENYDIYLGDARLEIANKPDEYYGGIISTATSSSTVPFHLMTKEAFIIYLSKLAPGGALVFLAPASYFDYTPLFAAYSGEFEMPIYELEMSFGGDYKYQYFLFLKPPANNQVLGKNLNWSLLQPSKKQDILWSDDYYNIWAVMK